MGRLAVPGTRAREVVAATSLVPNPVQRLKAMDRGTMMVTMATKNISVEEEEEQQQYKEQEEVEEEEQQQYKEQEEVEEEEQQQYKEQEVEEEEQQQYKEQEVEEKSWMEVCAAAGVVVGVHTGAALEAQPAVEPLG